MIKTLTGVMGIVLAFATGCGADKKDDKAGAAGTVGAQTEQGTAQEEVGLPTGQAEENKGNVEQGKTEENKTPILAEQGKEQGKPEAKPEAKPEEKPTTKPESKPTKPETPATPIEEKPGKPEKPTKPTQPSDNSQQGQQQQGQEQAGQVGQQQGGEQAGQVGQQTGQEQGQEQAGQVGQQAGQEQGGQVGQQTGQEQGQEQGGVNGGGAEQQDQTAAIETLRAKLAEFNGDRAMFIDKLKTDLDALAAQFANEHQDEISDIRAKVEELRSHIDASADDDASFLQRAARAYVKMEALRRLVHTNG